MPGRSNNSANRDDDQKAYPDLSRLFGDHSGFTGHFFEPRSARDRQEGDLEIPYGRDKLYHAQARMPRPPTGGYDPAIGRFWGADAMNFLYPKSNSYHYVFNNPVMYRDPSGMLVERIDGGYRISGDDIYTFLGYLRTIAEGSGSSDNLDLALEWASGKNDGQGGDMHATGREAEVTSTRLGDPLWNDTGHLTNAVSGFGTGMENIVGTFRMTNSKGNFDFRYYGNNWRGNQYVAPRNVAATGQLFSKYGSRAGGLVSVGMVGRGFHLDGYRFGYNTQIAAGQAVGGWGGAVAGAKLGAMGGGFLGPGGALVGGVVGGIAGGWGGSTAGERLVNNYHMRWSPQ